MPNIAYLDFTYDKSSLMTDAVNMPLTFVSLEDHNTIKIIRPNCPTNLYKSLDGGMSWSQVSYTDGSSLNYSGRELATLNKGQIVMLKGSFNGAWNEEPNSYDYDHRSFDSTGKFNLLGNIMSIAPGMTNNALPEISHMFDNIFSETKVVDASKLVLPATTLYEYCYREMFMGCIYLTSAPELPATTLAEQCYGGMFNGCTSLVNVPALKATTLANGCCIGMFENCTSLYEAPKLPATALADSCYLNMFNGCTSMVKPPALPATTLSGSCYNGMFQGCTSMTDAPELKAVTVPNYAYANMFYNCTSLNYIKIHATNREAQSIYNWVHNVAPTGTFIKHKNATYDIDSDSGVPIGWTVFDLDETIGEVYTVTISTTPSDTGSVVGAGRYRAGATVTLTGQPATGYKVKQYSKYTSPTTTEVVSTYNNSYQFVIKEDTHILAEFELDSEFNDYESVYFTITSLEDNNSIYFKMYNYGLSSDSTDCEEYDFDLEYSINNRPWVSVNLLWEDYADDYINNIYEKKFLITTINTGDTIRFRADRDTYVTYTSFNTEMSFPRFIVDKQYKVSGNVLSLLYASDNDKSSQYKFYYYGNASIPNGCFCYFFCPQYDPVNRVTINNGLVDASNLIIPDVTIGKRSFANMFADCRNLVKPPIGLYPSTLAQSCYSNMFQNCISLTEAPDLPATTLADWCYREMFEYCTLLIYPPELPATTLADYCYYEMFLGCESLLIQPYLYARELTFACYYEMFAGCTSLIGLPDPYRYATPGYFKTRLNSSSCARMFEGCTSITSARIDTDCMGYAPGYNIGMSCCARMFQGCTNLSSIYVNATDKINYDWDNDSYSPTYNWVLGVAPTGTFYKNSNLNWPVDSVHGIPIGWTAMNINTVLYDFNVYNSVPNAGYITKSPNSDLVYENAEVTVTATVTDNGYTFAGWKNNDGTIASYNSTYTFTATENINLTATWNGDSSTKYTLDIINSNPSCGTTSGAGRYTSGTTVTINAVPNNGWAFDRWEKTVGNITETYDNTTPRNVIVNTNMTWTAYWKRSGDGYKTKYFTITSLADNNKCFIMIPRGYYDESLWGQVNINQIEYRKNNAAYWSTITKTSTFTDYPNGYARNFYGFVFYLNNGETISLRYAGGTKTKIQAVGHSHDMWFSTGYDDWWKFTIQCKYNFKVSGNVDSLCPYGDYNRNSTLEYYDYDSSYAVYQMGRWRRDLFIPIAFKVFDGTTVYEDNITATNCLTDSSDLYYPEDDD